MFFFEDTEEITVLGLSGLAGSGKDYLAKSVAWRYNFIPLSLAVPFKTDICAKNPEYSFDEVFGETDRSEEVRKLLQEVGTEKGRDVFGQDVWTRSIEGLMKYFSLYGYSRFIIPDVRFPNELAWIKRLEGNVIRVVGRGGISGNRGQHVSENSLTDDPDLYDAVFDNSVENERTSVDRFNELVKQLTNVR